MEYKVKIYWGVGEVIDPANYNVDVEVTFCDGKRYSATFFTLKNIQMILDRQKKTGESENGLYFWTSDMIIVERVTEKVINDTISDLLNNGEFYTALEALGPE